MEECGDESTGVREKEVREIPIVFVVTCPRVRQPDLISLIQKW